MYTIISFVRSTNISVLSISKWKITVGNRYVSFTVQCMIKPWQGYASILLAILGKTPINDQWCVAIMFSLLAWRDFVRHDIGCPCNISMLCPSIPYETVTYRHCWSIINKYLRHLDVGYLFEKKVQKVYKYLYNFMDVVVCAISGRIGFKKFEMDNAIDNQAIASLCVINIVLLFHLKYTRACSAYRHLKVISRHDSNYKWQNANYVAGE